MIYVLLQSKKNMLKKTKRLPLSYLYSPKGEYTRLQVASSKHGLQVASSKHGLQVASSKHGLQMASSTHGYKQH